MSGKYKNIKELSEAFKSGKLKGWVLMVDNDSTHLRWIGHCPFEIDTEEFYEFEDKKCDEATLLWDSDESYILDQALDAAGIPNEGV